MLEKKRFIVCGYYGEFNLGDEAMLSGLICLLKNQNKNVGITVLSSNPKLTQRIHLVKAIHRGGNIINKLQKLFCYITHDYFILGGGDLLRDVEEKSLALSWLDSLQKANKLGCKTLVLGVSVGEIFREETKELMPRILNEVDFIGVRDFDSKLKLTNLGVTKQIGVISDLALECLADKTYTMFKKSDDINIGISIRSLEHRGFSVNQNIFSSIEKEIILLIDYLVEKYNAKIHLLPLQAKQTCGGRIDVDDYATSKKIREKVQYSENCILYSGFRNVDDFTKIVTNLDLVIGMRLHSLVLSAGLGIPIIAISYDSKVTSFMKEINQPQYVMRLNDFEHQKIILHIVYILENMQICQQNIRNNMIFYQEKINIISEFI